MLRELLPFISSSGENLFPVITCMTIHIAEACMTAYGVGYGFGNFSQFVAAVMLTCRVQILFDVGRNIVVVDENVDLATHGYTEGIRIVNL
jgi:hypothetical protein